MNKQFDTNDLPSDRIREIIHRAKKLCTNWQVEILDCTKSFARQKIDMSFEEFMETKFRDEKRFFTVIHRNGFGEDHLEVCFSTMGLGPDYFLYLTVDPGKAAELMRPADAEPAYLDSSDANLRDKQFCWFCDMPHYNCLCSHGD